MLYDTGDMIFVRKLFGFYIQIIWRPVIWGLGLQFIFGLLILRTSIGFKFFKILGDQINIFLEYSDVGAAFVFGNTFKAHFFAFKVQ